MKKILDVGCGNGAYLSKLCSSFPDQQYLGVEVEPAIFQRAQAKTAAHLSFYPFSYDGLPQSDTYDWVIARLVIAHIQSRRHFFQWLYDHMKSESTVWIMDIDEDHIPEYNGLPLFTALYKESRQSIHKPTFLRLKDALRVELTHHGFRHLGTQAYSLSTIGAPTIKRQLYAYMQQAAELMQGSPISAELSDELRLWFSNPDGHYEIHMFGMEFTK